MNNRMMIVYKENVFTRIKKFILNLFRKERDIQLQEVKEPTTKQGNMLDDIKISITEEEKELLKLQEYYKNNFIYSSDILPKERNKLIELYKKQNKKLAEQLEREKLETRLLISNLKKA